MRREVGDGRQRPAASWPRRSTRSAAASHLCTHGTSTPRSHMVSNKGELGACTQVGLPILDDFECECARSERRGSPLSEAWPPQHEESPYSGRIQRIATSLHFVSASPPQRLGRLRSRSDSCTSPDVGRARISLADAAGGRPRRRCGKSVHSTLA